MNVPVTEKRVFEFFGITEDQLPTLVVADMGSETGAFDHSITAGIFIKLYHMDCAQEFSSLFFLFIFILFFSFR